MSYGNADPLYDPTSDANASDNQPLDNSLYDVDHGATDQAIAAMMDRNTNDTNDPRNFPAPGDFAATDNPVGGRAKYDLATAGLSTENGVPFNQFPEPGGSRTGTVAQGRGSAVTDITSPAGQINLQTGQAYVPTAAELGPYAKPADVVTGTTPSVTAGLPGGGGTGQLSDAQWNAQFQKDMGYFNPQFESRAAFLEEAAQGDKAIRGQQAGGPHIDELARMAQYDSDAKRLYDQIRGTPDFYNSQNAATWDLNHNASLAQQAQAGAGLPDQQTGGQGFNGGLGRPAPQRAAQGPDTAWLRSQLVNDVASPVDNAHALMSDQMRSGVVDALAKLGATDFKMGIDGYGNATLNYTSKSGTPETIKASLVDYANALETLRQRVAAQPAAPPAGGGGGGSAPRGYAPRGGGYAPRGGGGGGGGAPGVGYPAGNEAIDQTAAGGGILLPGDNTKPGYYPDVQGLSYTNSQGQTAYKNPSGANVYYTPEGEPYGYYYGSKAAVGNIQGERRGLPY